MNTRALFGQRCRTGVSVFAAAALAVSLVPFAAFADDSSKGMEGAGFGELAAVEGVEGSGAGAASAEGTSPSDGAADGEAAAVEGLASAEGLAESATVNMMTDEEIDAVLQQLDKPATKLFASEVSTAGVDDPVTYLYGDTRYETAAAEALHAYPEGCKTVVVAAGTAWVDALSATGLAGALGAPILFVGADSVPGVTSDAIAQLGATEAIVIGSTDVIAASVEASLNALPGMSSVRRVAGADRFATQLAVYEFGQAGGYDSQNHWNGDMVLVATGWNFPDALSASSLAYSRHVPIFIADANGDLTAAQKQALVGAVKAKVATFATSVVLGSETVTSKRTEGFLWGLTQLGAGTSKSTVRLGGATRYDTSALIAEWCVNQGYLSWDKAAFTTGLLPYDALAGSAVQGRDGSVMLLVDDASSTPVTKAVENTAAISSIKFFGSDNAIAASTKVSIALQLNLYPGVTKWDCGLSFEAMVSLEVNSVANQTYQRYTRDEIIEYLNPANFLYGTAGYYQFAVLNAGYSGKVNAAHLNAYISSTSNGATGKLAGTGQYFVDAATQSGVNEVYLLTHAILETGWGTSALASGTWYDGNGFWNGSTWVSYPGHAAGTYYNFFGIGAYDSDPFVEGIEYAINKGWNSPTAAIVGGAQWIASGSSNYLNNSYGQNTLYKMKWNCTQAATEATVWKQYATGRSWAYGIARLMAECYSANGIAMRDSGLTFDYPVYD